MTRKDAERQEAIENLRTWIAPGDTVYTILDSVSRSGMSRVIRVVLLECEGRGCRDVHPNWAVGMALGLRHAKRNGREQDGLVVGGGGMDMGYHLVYTLARTLWPDGHGCLGATCPSNDHANGDRDRTPDPYPNEPVRGGVAACLAQGRHWHKDGGFALRHRWL